jgi:hypothetical protein
LTTRITRPAYANPAKDKNADYATPPPPASRSNDRGMWVVGHEDYDKVVWLSTVRSSIGSLVFPSVQWRAKDSKHIKCVAPAEWEGGTLAAGRPYVPRNT